MDAESRTAILTQRPRSGAVGSGRSGGARRPLGDGPGRSGDARPTSVLAPGGSGNGVSGSLLEISGEDLAVSEIVSNFAAANNINKV